jgi:uncharacterized protein (DUF885 family)
MKRRDFLATSASVLAVSAAGPFQAFAATPAEADLARLLDNLFEKSIDMSPESATSNGLDKGARAPLKAKLDDESAAGYAKRVAYNKQALARIEAINAAGLGTVARNQHDVAAWVFRQRLNSEPFDLRSVRNPYPITQRGGAYFSVPDFLNTQHTVETPADAEAYLSRLSEFARVLDEESAYQRSIAPRGVIAPGWSLDLAMKQMRTLREQPAAGSGLVDSLAERAQAKDIAGDWRTRAAKIVESEVYPALDRQYALLEDLRGQTPEGDGVWRLPQGEALYAAALRDSITTDLSPDEVHRIGLEQVAEISAQLGEILTRRGMTGATVGDKLTALNTSPDQLYPNTDEGRAAMLADLNKSYQGMQARLPRAFADVPNEPLEIRRVPPEIEEGASNGYYYRAPLDGSRPAIYWINLRDTKDRPRYQLPSLTYHEGVPGHHLQLSYAGNAEGTPLLLRTLFISAYGEGWALYSEQLADELGGYEDIERVGYLQSFLFRAARLVVDTGIHSKRWSREQATQYFIGNVGLTQGRSLSEIQRYCVTPGQACSYKIGHNKWLELRQRAQAKLGDKFSLPWFHAILTEGLMPLELLERRVDQRIAERLRGA